MNLELRQVTQADCMCCRVRARIQAERPATSTGDLELAYVLGVLHGAAATTHAKPLELCKPHVTEMLRLRSVHNRALAAQGLGAAGKNRLRPIPGGKA